MLPKEQQQQTTNTTGIGVPGSQYSQTMAKQSSPSSMDVRKKDVGGGYYQWEQLNSVTGQYELIGQPIPYETNKSGGAVDHSSDVTVVTPGGTQITFGQEREVTKQSAYTSPESYTNNDGLITEERDFTGAGGQQGVEVGNIYTVKGYVYNPDIGYDSERNPSRYIPAEIGMGGGITGQGYIDKETGIFNYAFKRGPNIDYTKGAPEGYKPDTSKMKLYDYSGKTPVVYDTAVSNPNDNSITFSSNTQVPVIDNVNKASIIDSVFGLKANAATGDNETQNASQNDVVTSIMNAFDPPVKADKNKTWTMEDVNAGRISQHDYMEITNKPAVIESFNWFLAKQTKDDPVKEIIAQTFSIIPMFAASGGGAGYVKNIKTIGVDGGIVGKMVKDAPIENVIPKIKSPPDVFGNIIGVNLKDTAKSKIPASMIESKPPVDLSAYVPSKVKSTFTKVTDTPGFVIETETPIYTATTVGPSEPWMKGFDAGTPKKVTTQFMTKQEFLDYAKAGGSGTPTQKIYRSEYNKLFSNIKEPDYTWSDSFTTFFKTSGGRQLAPLDYSGNVKLDVNPSQDILARQYLKSRKLPEIFNVDVMPQPVPRIKSETPAKGQIDDIYGLLAEDEVPKVKVKPVDEIRQITRQSSESMVSTKSVYKSAQRVNPASMIFGPLAKTKTDSTPKIKDIIGNYDKTSTEAISKQKTVTYPKVVTPPKSITVNMPKPKTVVIPHVDAGTMPDYIPDDITKTGIDTIIRSSVKPATKTPPYKAPGAFIPMFGGMGGGGAGVGRKHGKKTRALWQNPIEQFNPFKSKKNGVKKVKSNRKIKSGRR